MIRRLFAFVRRSRHQIQRDVDDELAFHLETRADELQAAGADPATANAQARREFGDIRAARHDLVRIDDQGARLRKRRDYMGDLRQDIRYALRQLRASPGFTATAVLTLALGIGASAAIFSVVNAVLFRPLPFPEPGRLYAVYSANRTGDLLQARVSPVDLDDWRAGRQRIEDIGGYFFAEGSSGVDLTGRGDPRRLAAVFVTPGFFSALGVTPLHGRLPREEELVRGGPHEVVMLSHGFWTREFGASTGALTSTLTLNGRPYQIIGVLPDNFRFPTDHSDLFVPYSTIPDTSIPRLRQVRTLSVVARVRAAETQAELESELNGIARGLARQYPENRAWDAVTVRPLHDVVVGPVQGPLLVLFGAVGVLVLAACVNVASLLVARSAARSREIGVRLALGAGRGRLIRQLLTESVVLAALGGTAGLAAAYAILTGVLAFAVGQLPRSAEVRLDGAVLGFAMLMSLVTAVLVGLVPALRAASSDVQGALRHGGRGVAGGDGQRLRSALVVAEVSLAVVLVVGAGLMARSFAALMSVDPGFRADHLVAVQFTIDPTRYPSQPAAPNTTAAPTVAPYALFAERVIDAVRALPGVASASAVKDPPFRGTGERVAFNIPGHVVPAGQDPPSAMTIHVYEGYFRTIGARIAAGREFTRQDRVGAPFVVMVNEAFGRRYFPGQAVAGQHLLVGRGTRVEIIGVVNDIRQVAMAEPAEPAVYFHNVQNSRIKTTIVARTHGEPLAMADTIRRTIWSLDPRQAITTTFTFDDAVGRALARPRLVTVLMGAFGAIGLGLGALGLYGVLAFFVQQRRREIGVRLALGARPGQVRAMFVRRGLILTGVGLAIGLSGALLLTGSVSAVLYGVEPADPVTFATVGMLLLVTAALASWLPASRAARIDPVETLRVD
jgi:predicted permease